MKKVMHLVLAGTAAFASAAVLAEGGKMNKQSSGAQASPSAQHTSASSSQSQSPEMVKKVQEALASQGYDPGPVDGIMGQRTAQALKKAQSDKNLNATGQLDSQTLAALGVNEGGSSSTATGSSSSGSGASGGAASSPSSESTSGSSGSSPGSASSSGAPSSGSNSGSSGSGSSGSGSSGSGSSEAGAGASGSGASGSKK